MTSAATKDQLIYRERKQLEVTEMPNQEGELYVCFRRHKNVKTVLSVFPCLLSFEATRHSYFHDVAT